MHRGPQMAQAPLDLVVTVAATRAGARSPLLASGSGQHRCPNAPCPQVRRVTAMAAAKRLGVSVRTLEDWRQSWRHADEEGKPELRKGPKFFRVGKRVLYDVHDLDAFNAARRARGLHRA